MKWSYFIFPLLIFNSVVNASEGGDSLVQYYLPDSVRAISFVASIEVKGMEGKKEPLIGIQTDLVKLSLESDKKKGEIVFEFPKHATIVATGLDIQREKGELSWKYNWSLSEVYKLLLASASDSAGNFMLYSGYIYLPKESKWKLIGTCKIQGQWGTIKAPATFFNNLQVTVTDVWVQRNSGGWKNLDATDTKPPVINVMSHVDSTRQFEIDRQRIQNAIGSDRLDATFNNEGVYYKILKEGTGRKVSVNDTVTVYYRLTLLNDTAIVDQAKEKPATFPLNRLIRGWQVALPLCGVGCKIALVIPSAQAYSIRTRSPKIPPNSILVFEIEVVDAKAPSGF